MSPGRGRPREFDTEAALDAAMGVFWKQGYEATSVSELCDAMRVARQSMYDWVGDKKALYLLAVERYNQQRICGLRDMLSMDESPMANLRHCLHAMAEYAKQEDCMGCLVTNTESEFGTSDADVSAMTDRIERFIVGSFRDVLERARDAGEVPASLDCEAMGAALAVVRNGLMVAGRSGQSHESIDQTISMVEAMLRTG
ncbi:MAG: TetR/AcrR family transcriptional regulator [Planctomycetota bacterium]